jgi:hypothetical protein
MIVRRLAGLGVALVCVLGLFGCGGGAMRIEGKVVGGATGVVTLAEAGDARLGGPGVPGVSVRVHRPGAPNAPVAEATSGAEGGFTLRVPESDVLGGRMEVVASGPGVLVCRGSVYLPRDGRRLLVFVERSGGGGASAR